MTLYMLQYRLRELEDTLGYRLDCRNIVKKRVKDDIAKVPFWGKKKYSMLVQYLTGQNQK